MSAKHTPGKWEIGDENNSHAEVCIGDSETVASLSRESSYTGSMMMSREEMLANARLIAAAPQMLEALNRCDSAFAKFDPDPDSRYGMAWTEVKAAIAAATGEEG